MTCENIVVISSVRKLYPHFFYFFPHLPQAKSPVHPRNNHGLVSPALAEICDRELWRQSKLAPTASWTLKTWSAGPSYTANFSYITIICTSHFEMMILKYQKKHVNDSQNLYIKETTSMRNNQRYTHNSDDRESTKRRATPWSRSTSWSSYIYIHRKPTWPTTAPHSLRLLRFLFGSVAQARKRIK